ncbi:glycosyltransferase family 2 protein [Novosphingobium sp. ST904]|uniref:glycosyltransferase family 2 protein n=1 Tax=Novosphingobium sp. ST904 TaxID=1684385 RepID=UPI001E461560|nr:glycosyltransferase family A protein [Novosphingobium sp. ST904]
MRLSVLTIVKNRAGHLAQLIEGLRRSAAAPFELVVVDMGSDPPATIGDLPFPARVVRLDGGGLPLAAARNAAARAASGDYLLFLDVDCIPMRGLVDAMADALAANDALICAQVRYLGPRTRAGTGRRRSFWAVRQGTRGVGFPLKGSERWRTPGFSGRWSSASTANASSTSAVSTKPSPATAPRIPISGSGRAR